MLTVSAGMVAAQTGVEIGGAVVGTAGPTLGLVVGPTFAWRPGRRDQLATLVALGSRGEGLLVRMEALWRVQLAPPTTTRGILRPYLGGGLALETDGNRREWLVVALGVESRPANRNGWNVEVGWGGGLRLLAGFQWP